MMKIKVFVLFLISFALCSIPCYGQNNYKVRLKRSDGNGGLIVLKNTASRSAAETAALADGDSGSDTAAVDVEKLNSSEASMRGQATESTLGTVSSNIAGMTVESADATNSTSSTLTSNATWNGGFVSLAGAESITVSVLVDQNSATNGLTVKWSDDGTNTIITQSFTVSASSDFLETLPRRALYYKLGYVNGGTTQGAFDLRTRKIPRYSSLGTANLPQQVNLTSSLPAGTNTIGNVNVGTGKTISRLSISVFSSGDTSLISAPGSGLKIKIVSLFLANTDSTDNIVVLKSDSTSINGAGIVLEGKKFVQVFDGVPGLKTLDLGTNEALQINLSSSTDVSGYILYYTE